MHLYFAGAESPSHHNVLRSEGIVRVAVNVTALSRRVQNLDGWATQERLDGLEWILYADSPDTPWDAALTILSGAMEAGVPPEAVVGPVSWAENTWLGDSEVFFMPTWDGSENVVLRHYVETYGGTMLPDTVVESAASVRSAVAASHGSVLGAITGRSKGLENFNIVISSAWWAVQKHGETQVWDHGKLNRYNSKDKLAKRTAHRKGIERLGVDPDLVIADDSAAVARLALRSWLELERHVSDGPLAPVVSLNPSAEVTNMTLGDSLVGGSTSVRVDSDRVEGRHAVLPVMGIERMSVTSRDADGVEHTSDVETLTVTAESLRQCNNCSLSLQCPSFQEGARCAYNIPVLIRSKDQLQGVLRAMVEVQSQRVMMARFGEEITGTPDPDVGREMDRLFKMVATWKEIEDNRDTLEVSIKGKGEMGMLSRLFGAKVGSNAMVLDSPVPSATVTSRMTED